MQSIPNGCYPMVSYFLGSFLIFSASFKTYTYFLEDGHSFEEDFRILPIVRLVYPPMTMAKRRERLEEFELHWQENLITYKPYGMNKAVELERTMVKLETVRKVNNIECYVLCSCIAQIG